MGPRGREEGRTPARGLTLTETFHTTAANRPYAKTHPCHWCGKPFIVHPTKGWEETLVVVTEERVSIFQGEDVVRFYHPGCYQS